MIRSKYTVLKWLPKKHKYKKYRLPVGSCLYSDDMEKEIACCQCGKIIKYGDSYTSRTIHTEMGIGFAECEECYKRSIKNEHKIDA